MENNKLTLNLEISILFRRREEQRSNTTRGGLIFMISSSPIRLFVNQSHISL